MLDDAKRQTQQWYDWLEGQLGSKEYFAGESFGWADIGVAHCLNGSIWMGYGPKAGSPLDKYYKRIKERPSVKETWKEFYANADGLGARADAFKTGELVREYRDHRLEWIVKAGGLDIIAQGIKDKNIRFQWPYGQATNIEKA